MSTESYGSLLHVEKEEGGGQISVPVNKSHIKLKALCQGISTFSD